MTVTAQNFDGNLRLAQETITNRHLSTAAEIERTKLALDSLKPYVIPFTDFRVWDALATLLPSAGASDDLGLIGGTFGTNTPCIETGDVKAAGAVTRYARVLVRLPAEYDDGETVTVRLKAGMVTTVADVTATIDVQAYQSDGFAGVSADLCATAAITINSLTQADKDFTITPTSLVAGDWLDIRITIATNDAATATVVKGRLGVATLLCDVRG